MTRKRAVSVEMKKVKGKVSVANIFVPLYQFKVRGQLTRAKTLTVHATDDERNVVFVLDIHERVEKSDIS